MKFIDINSVALFNAEKFVAQALLEGEKSNVRIIRLSSGQTLPPHTHGDSDLFLFIVEGEGEFNSENGSQILPCGSLIFMKGSEELRVSNSGKSGLTLLAFLTPKFPPAQSL